MTEELNLIQPQILHRAQNGLYENIQYDIGEDGFINWRNLIDKKYLYPNKEWFERKNLPVPTSIEGLEDHQLLIKIGGINQLARLRGYSSVDMNINNVEPGYVTSKCTINWIGNIESGGQDVSFSWVANSNFDNCGAFMQPYQETQAANRAFNLCVRKFLNINIVSDEELGKGQVENTREEKEDDSGPTAQKTLRKVLTENGVSTKDGFSEFLRKRVADGTITQDLMDSWSSCDEIPAKFCRKFIGILKK